MSGGEPTYDALLARADAPAGSTWGLWPGREVLGCLNRLTPDRVVRAAGLVRRGDVYPLDLDPELPDPPLFGRERMQREVKWLGDVGHDEVIDRWNTQSSSQWDGFRHIRSREHGFHGGVADEDHGIHHWNGVVGRGVLADVARWRASEGRPIEPGTSDIIDPDDVTACLAAQGAAVEHGDVLILRTGWLAWYRSLDATQRVEVASSSTACGLRSGVESARLLWDLGIAAIAADNPALEVFPPGTGNDAPRGDEGAFLHFALLPRLGMPIGELWDLDALADACASDGVYDFLFTSAPLRLRGGVASPPNALAIR